MRRAICLPFVSFLIVTVGWAQTPTSDPQAIAFAQQAITALTGGNVPSDITIQGNVTEYLGGNSITGNATFQAKGFSESLYSAQASQRETIRGFDSTGAPAGLWTDSSGAAHPMALHNLWTDASWFYPALSSLNLPLNTQAVVSYVGQESRYGTAVQHLQVEQYLPSQPPSVTDFVWQMSEEDIYLDASSLLPLGITFNIHPSSNALVNIAVEVVFSNFQTVSEAQVPFHIQKYVNGNLVMVGRRRDGSL